MVKQATFRFYEELNDYLLKEKKKVDFVHTFKGTPSIKEVIEAIGVPHVEVDLILVNGESVDFNYSLKNNDFVSVYPVFETLEISNVTHLRENPLRETKFILDVHLGKLARYLRMLGFDSTYQNDNDDQTIIRISRDENRIILTRDRGILKIKTVSHAYYIRNHQPKDQITEVLRYFDLYRAIDPFNRCIKCNGKLERVEKEEVIEQLEPLTKKYYHTFFRCTDCRSVFWEGSHFEHMRSFINKVTGIVENRY